MMVEEHLVPVAAFDHPFVEAVVEVQILVDGCWVVLYLPHLVRMDHSHPLLVLAVVLQEVQEGEHPVVALEQVVFELEHPPQTSWVLAAVAEEGHAALGVREEVQGGQVEVQDDQVEALGLLALLVVLEVGAGVLMELLAVGAALAAPPWKGLQKEEEEEEHHLLMQLEAVEPQS
jgi:hypothetical protein